VTSIRGGQSLNVLGRPPVWSADTFDQYAAGNRIDQIVADERESPRCPATSPPVMDDLTRDGPPRRLGRGRVEDVADEVG
jgi:hypothetical protein